MNQSALDAAGLGSIYTASLWWILFAVCTAVFAIVAVALGYAMWHPRVAVKGGKIDAVPGNEFGVWRLLFSAVAIIALTLLSLLVADFVTARKVMSSGAPPDPNPITIKVTAHQWWWEVRYPNA